MRYNLKLYIGGVNPYSNNMKGNLIRILDEKIKGNYELEIIDIIQDPQAGEVNHIVGTPVFELIDPEGPRKRISGEDVNNKEKVFSLLGLNQ